MVISSDIIVPTWRCVNGIKVLKTSRLIWVSPRVGRMFGKYDWSCVQYLCGGREVRLY